MGGSINSTNSSSPEEQPPAISIDHDTGLTLLALVKSASVSVTLQLLELSPLDGSAALLWCMAVGTVIAGSLWAGSDALAEARTELEQRDRDYGAGHQGEAQGSGHGKHQEVLEITAAGAVWFVLLASAMLLILFFFLNEAFFYVILVMFSLAGAQALGALFIPVLAALVPKWQHRTVDVACLGPLPVLALAVTPVALAVAAGWGVCRNSSWSWVLQDVLGIAIMLLVLRTLRLGSLRVACVLLPLCFFYDVFWVFLQPLLFGDGSSVMVQVAEGAGSKEFLPMLLRVPRLSGPPIVHGYSLLGFGDVILPGLLLALSRAIDLKSGTPCVRGYFVPAVVGYGAGLLLTYTALMFSWFGDEGQPALLYLVPCTLGVVLGLAAWRGELRDLLAEKEGQAWNMVPCLDERDGYDDALCEEDGEEDGKEAVAQAGHGRGPRKERAEERARLIPRGLQSSSGGNGFGDGVV
jgi:signal peptide peptidase-like protein 2B